MWSLRLPIVVQERLHCQQLFSWMNQHVCLEMRRSCEGVFTLFATEKFFSGMSHIVALEERGFWGRIITTCASNRLLTTMNQNMLFFKLLGCKWRTSFWQSKAFWDGLSVDCFSHSFFFKPRIFEVVSIKVEVGLITWNKQRNPRKMKKIAAHKNWGNRVKYVFGWI